MYECERWIIKKPEDQRNDAFELWCWKRLLRVPWPARISKQAILKEISPEYSLERLLLKLKLQNFSHLIWKANPLEKTLILGKTERKGGIGGREWDGYHHWHNKHEFEWTLGVDDGQGVLVCCDSWSRKESDTTEWLNWTEQWRNNYWIPW